MIIYKLNEILKERNIPKIRFAKIANLSPKTMQKLANNQVVTTDTINRICFTLQCQPKDIMEYVYDETDEEFWKRYKDMMGGIKEAKSTGEAVETLKEALQTQLRSHKIKH